jgi:hypothetical protein
LFAPFELVPSPHAASAINAAAQILKHTARKSGRFPINCPRLLWSL